MKRKVVQLGQMILCLILLLLLAGGAGIGRACGELLQNQNRFETQLQQGDPAAYVRSCAPKFTVLDAELLPAQAVWEENLAAGLPQNLLYRLAEIILPQDKTSAVALNEDREPEELITASAQWGFEIPENTQADFYLEDEQGNVLYNGPLAGAYSRTFEKAGTDTCRLTLYTQTLSGEGTFTWYWSVTLQPQLTVTVLNENPAQGQVVPVLVQGNVFEEPMSLETELGLCDFVPLEPAGTWAAYVPVAYNRAAGVWPIQVTVGEQSYNFTVTVKTTDFSVQYMTIDQDVADSTWNSAAASAEYRAAVYPLYELTDTEKYWDGVFIQPVSDYRLTTEYGLWRYTNGVYSERHSGIDMACPTGTPVVAPQNGVVLLAQYLQLTGNTVVIAHGGGIKSMFYHMDSLNVATGDEVHTGDKIGEVGTTGYSTGPHLHYEVKIGSQSIDPFALFDGTSGVYGGQNLNEK